MEYTAYLPNQFQPVKSVPLFSFQTEKAFRSYIIQHRVRQVLRIMQNMSIFTCEISSVTEIYNQSRKVNVVL